MDYDPDTEVNGHDDRMEQLAAEEAKKVTLKELLAVGHKPVSMFRRQAFHLAPNRAPKWHYLYDSKRGVFRAICGYAYDFTLSTPLLRSSVKTKNLVCGDCLKVKKKLEEAREKKS